VCVSLPYLPLLRIFHKNANPPSFIGSGSHSSPATKVEEPSQNDDDRIFCTQKLQGVGNKVVYKKPPTLVLPMRKTKLFVVFFPTRKQRKKLAVLIV